MTSIQSEPTSLKPGREGQLSGRPCPICCATVKICEAVDELLLRGDSVKAVHRWAVKRFPAELGALKYDTFTRHARFHVKAVARAVRKLSDHARLQRQKVETAKAVLADDIDPVAFFAPAQLAKDISRTEKRLDDAATDAASTKQHSSLASLSGALIRSFELRGKLGGSIQDKTEVSISIGLQDLHGRLDQLVGTSSTDRQSTARSLLGLMPLPTPLGLAPMSNLDIADDQIPARRRPVTDIEELTNPAGSPLTIDVEPAGRAFAPAPAPEAVRTPESRPAGPPEALEGHFAADRPADSAVDAAEVGDDPAELGATPNSGELLGTRWGR